jgi:tetratricopeptide (TPR) repeat protein
MQLYANAPAAETKQIAEIGFRLLDTGATSEASQVFHDLARNSPRNGDAHRGLGEVAFRSGDYEAARHEFQRAVRLAPADQQNAQQLALTNEVIGLDPGLAHISSIERLRRSRNLLTRVLKDLEACLLPEAEARGSQPPKPKAGATAGVLATGLQQRLEAARRQLLPDQHGDADDRALQVQDTAEQLWRDRSAFCESNPVADRPLDIVVLRLRYE